MLYTNWPDSSGILEKEEFEYKKINLEAQIEKYEIDFMVEEKISKLEQAFAQLLKS